MGINSNLQILAILAVFTLAGPTVVFIRGWYFNLLGFDDTTPVAVKTIAYLLFIFPAYQVLLLLLDSCSDNSASSGKNK